jgi:PDZ domain
VACSDFDGQVVRQDPEIAKLAEQFICVRIQSMNGANIGLFQFDGDLTWMAFFMDARDHFYARYGGREDASAESHLNRESLVYTMRTVLDWHAAGKVQPGQMEPQPLSKRMPEDDAVLAARISARKAGNRCIHCHDVKQAEMEALRKAGTFTKDRVFSYPMPGVLGLDVDRTEQNKIARVRSGSFGALAGLQSGDRLRQVDGQRILTAADLARVLQLTPDEARLQVQVERDGRIMELPLTLTGHWRQTANPSWRSSSYVAGPNAGIWGEQLDAKKQEQLGIAADSMAFRVTFLFAGHESPIKAGLKLQDVIIDFDGLRRPLTARELNNHCQMHHDFGDKVPLIVRREGKDMKLTLELPVKPPQLR